MGRRIITKALQTTGGGAVDSYEDRVVKYIPADVVAAWVAAAGLIGTSKGTSSEPGRITLWIVFAVGVILAAAWTWKQTKKPGLPFPTTQILISTGAFVVWVFAIGGPFPEWLGLYNALRSSLLLIGYTAAVGIITP